MSLLAQSFMLSAGKRRSDGARLLQKHRGIGVAIAGTAVLVGAAFEFFRPVETTWVLLPPEPRTVSDWPAPASSSGQESKAARRFRHAFDDPTQPLFSRVTAINPALFSLPPAADADEPRMIAVANEAAPDQPEMGSSKDIAQAVSPDPSPSISFAGIWAPSASACSPKSNSRQLLPAVINEEGAWAGEVSCRFQRSRQVGNTAILTSTCSNGRQRWTANVRLAVSGDRLVWTSERGSQTYVRCAPRIVEARAGI